MPRGLAYIPRHMETPALTPANRFNSIIERLFCDLATVATNPWSRLAPAELVLIKLIWRRLRRMTRRFADILAHLRAGTLAQPEPRTASAPAATPRASGPRPQQPSQRLGWVIYAVSWFIWNRHYELAEMLEDPETATLVADAPQLGGVLRPLCRMLKVKQPAWLRLPRKPRRRVAKPPPPPPPDWLLAEPGAELRADGTVWMRMGGSTKWRPGHFGTLEERQKVDPPRRVWPRED